MQDREHIKMLHNNLSAILILLNSSHMFDTTQLNVICKNTYESIVVNFHWANITPSLHKLLPHSAELIEKYKNDFGLGFGIFHNSIEWVSQKVQRTPKKKVLKCV